MTRNLIIDAHKQFRKTLRQETLEGFNRELLRLMVLLPRKNSDVAELLAKSLEDIDNIVLREESLLSAMEVLFNFEVVKKKTDKRYDGGIVSAETYNPLDAQVEYASDVEKKKITELLSNRNNRAVSRAKLVQVFKITKDVQESNYERYRGRVSQRNERLLWHGSETPNWVGIIKKNLQIPTRATCGHGNMFGYGIYFADDSIKSLGYTSLSGSIWGKSSSDKGILGLYAVELGKTYTTSGMESNKSSRYRKGNYESLSVKGGGSVLLSHHKTPMLEHREM